METRAFNSMSNAQPDDIDAVASAVRANTQFATDIFAELRAGSLSGEGVTRDTYGKGEQFAHDLVIRHARAMSLDVAHDAARNTYMMFSGKDRALPAVIVGSHLDSVANGGNFDGAAGVVAGLVAVRTLQSLNFQPACDVTIMAVRAEESVWFEQSYIGSRSALGSLRPEALKAKRIDTGMTLEDYIRQAGGDPDAIRAGRPYLTKEKVRAFLEVHIEQAPALVDANCSIGIATGIPGNFRYPNAKVIGEYGHVGLYRKFRRDAALAAAELFHGLDRVWEQWEQKGRPMACTIGRLHTDPTEDGLTKVAGQCTFSLDVRAYSESDLEELHGALMRLATEIGQKRNVRFDFGAKTTAEVALVDPDVRRQLESVAREGKLPYICLGSPASHDAAAFAFAGVPMGMIFIRNENGSHNPAEAMEIPDFLDAATVLTCWLLQTLR
jgi:beta-ureidopropionase / N-carbamoyl-L-amino-acid hydrolase